MDIFFVISGFLISGIIFEELDRGAFNFGQFYARRIRRIFPALLLAMAACLTFGWFAMLAGEYKQLGKRLAAGAGFISNLTLWQESGYFDSAADTKPLLHLWSLGIEEQFYMLWPVALWAAYRVRASRLAFCLAIARRWRSIRRRLLAGHGCLPFISFQNYGPQEDNRSAKKCYALTGEALAMAAAVESIRTVVLVSRGPLYFSGHGFGMEESDVRWRGWTVEPLRATAPMSNQQAFVEGYVEVSKRLLALGKKVVFVIDVPEFGINPEVCIANRPVAFRNQSLPSCVLSRALVDARQKKCRELVARIQTQAPGLLVYDTRGVFCDEVRCASKDSEQVYFYDNNHVNLSGSAKLLGGLDEWLGRQ